MGRKAALKRRRKVEGRSRAPGWAPPRDPEPVADTDEPPFLDARPAQEALGRRLRHEHEAVVLETPANMPRISDALDEVAGPFLEELHAGDEAAAFVVAYETAWAVWNLALKGEADQAVLLLQARWRLQHEVRRGVVPAVFLDRLDDVVEVRRTRFAHDRRKIQDVEVQTAPGGVRLAVAFGAL